jgi:epoxyqueuosine reductase
MPVESMAPSTNRPRAIDEAAALDRRSRDARVCYEMAVDPAAATQLIADEARALGFHRVGFAPVAPLARHALYESWLARGFGADMEYLAAQSGERRDARSIVAGARTVVSVALSYAHDVDVPVDRLARGTIARYARGDDYHVVMKTKLHALARAVAAKSNRAVVCLPCVDTAPVLEREWASAAGIGFQAKNTMLIAPGLGSYLLLGELVTDLECAPITSQNDASQPRCGQCRRCLDACPTGAFVDEYTLDSRRCISYLTIENRGDIPRDLRRLVGDRVFGCDVCQDVCPFNAGNSSERAPAAPELRPRNGYARPSLTALLGLGAAQFRKWQRGSALRRIHRPQLLRNVAVALGNVGGVDELPPLMHALGEPWPLVRAHVAWAIAQIVARQAPPPSGNFALRQLLSAALAREPDDAAREELSLALASLAATPPPPA